MKKIILLYDVDGWAWHHKALALKNNLPEYDITVKAYTKVTVSELNNYDHVHFFGWMEALNKNCSTGISSFNYKLLHSQRSASEIPKFKAVSCVSKELYECVKSENLNKNIFLCENGVDPEKFPYLDKKRKDKFVVGWIGQQTKGSLVSKPIDMKGYEHILLPLKEMLKNNSDIELLVHSNNYTTAISHNSMVDVYKKIDLLIHTAFLDGTPNTAFEAASCGIPVLSTSVGCIPELITNDFNGIVLNSYKNEDDAKNTVKEFYDKIIYLSKNRELCDVMGDNNRKVIEEKWTWKDRAKMWIPLFESY